MLVEAIRPGAELTWRAREPKGGHQRHVVKLSAAYSQKGTAPRTSLQGRERQLISSFGTARLRLSRTEGKKKVTSYIKDHSDHEGWKTVD